MASLKHQVVIDVTNHRGERSYRRIEPVRVWHGESPYHEDGEQWFLRAVDQEKGAMRDFAMKDVHGWRPATLKDLERLPKVVYTETEPDGTFTTGPVTLREGDTLVVNGFKLEVVS